MIWRETYSNDKDGILRYDVITLSTFPEKLFKILMIASFMHVITMHLTN